MILTINTFITEKKSLISINDVLVFTNGCFDILHRGHIEYLNEAKKLGDKLIIGINTDLSVKRLKGNSRPIFTLMDRAFALDNLKAVDFVIPFNEDTPLKLIEEIQPNVLVKGGDYNPEEIVGYEQVRQYGGKVITIPFVKGYSTSLIIEKIKNL